MTGKHVETTEFKKALALSRAFEIPILSPYPPYKSVTCGLMTQSARDRILTELRAGWLTIQLTQVKHLAAAECSLQRSVAHCQPTPHVWHSLIMQKSVLTRAQFFMALTYETKQHADECAKKTGSRHARMIGFVESRLTQLL